MNIEITPASVDQVIRGRGGKLITIESDVGNVASKLTEIDSRLQLAYNETGGYYVVYRTLDDGSMDLVTTAMELDDRIVERLRQVYSPDYDFNAIQERLEKQKERELDHAFTEKVGEVSEKLAWAIREDLANPKPGNVYIPSSISPSRNRVFVGGPSKAGIKRGKNRGSGEAGSNGAA